MDKTLENLLNLSLDQVMSDRFGRYSKYIIQERALPDVRDGLKPVQRRILYSMNDLSLFFNKSFKKSARVVGDVIGKYHPHGDTSIYEALVRLSQPWKMNMPLVEMHGNNGSIDDDPAAAMRYTEVRLEKISNLILKDIKKNTVRFAPNFDDSETEPTVLPALFPNLLVNGAKGIAAGYATEMPPHNLGEVIDAIIAKIKSPNARLDTLLKYIKGPDFPTGGIVKGTDGIYQAFERGRGKIIIRSKYEVSNLKTKPSITISEIPFGVVKSKLVRQIDEIRYNNKISGIKDVRDETDRNGLSIFIELSPGANVEAILNYLLSKTDMQVYYNYNNVAIKDKAPNVMNLSDILEAYIKHQKIVQTKSIENDLNKNEKRLEIVNGLIRVAEIADEVIDTIRKASGSKAGVVKTLVEKFTFTQLQAEAIAELRLYRLSRTDQSIYIEEKAELEKQISWAKNILGNENEFDKFLISLLQQMKKEYAVPRKTIIDGQMETINIDMDALIKDENVWIGVSEQGYLKRFSNRSYESNKLEDYTLKENDALKYIQQINTKDKLLVFTNYGNFFCLPVHKIIETKFKDVGKHINDFGSLQLDEQIVTAISIKDFDINSYIVCATKFGKIKRTLVKDHNMSRPNKIYKSFNLKNGDEIKSVQVSNGQSKIIVITNKSNTVKYSENQIPIQGLKSSGVKAMNVWDGEVASMTIVDDKDVLGLVSNRGGMKRMKVSSIAPMSRTTKGKSLFRELKANPHIVVDAKVVTTQTSALYFAEKTSNILFNKVDITSTDEGFSIVDKNATKATIIDFTYVSNNNEFFSKKENVSIDDKFDAAEKAIENIGQINIDDLLK